MGRRVRILVTPGGVGPAGEQDAEPLANVEHVCDRGGARVNAIYPAYADIAPALNDLNLASSPDEYTAALSDASDAAGETATALGHFQAAIQDAGDFDDLADCADALGDQKERVEDLRDAFAGSGPSADDRAALEEPIAEMMEAGTASATAKPCPETRGNRSRSPTET